jgi:uncharacterized protein YegP (UPF0339 family)
MYFILFRNNTDNLWYWNLHTEHHASIANGTDGHISKNDARREIDRVRRTTAFCKVYDKTTEEWEK